MKKNILRFATACTIFAAIASAPSPARAQDRQNEIRAFYNDGLTTAIVTLWKEVWDNSRKENNSGRLTEFGGYGVGYRKKLSERFQMGADISYLSTKMEIGVGDSAHRFVKMWDRKSNYLYLMPVAQFQYKSNRIMKMYGSASLGVVYSYTEKTKFDMLRTEHDLGLAFQAYPFGIRVGKALGGFCEVGIGYKGFLNIGFDYHF